MKIISAKERGDHSLKKRVKNEKKIPLSQRVANKEFK